MASQELDVLQEVQMTKILKEEKQKKWTDEETEKLIDLLEKNTCSCFTTSCLFLLFVLIGEFTRSAAKHFRVLRG